MGKVVESDKSSAPTSVKSLDDWVAECREANIGLMIDGFIVLEGDNKPAITLTKQSDGSYV